MTIIFGEQSYVSVQYWMNERMKGWKYERMYEWINKNIRTGTGSMVETSAETDAWTSSASTLRGSSPCSRRYFDKVYKQIKDKQKNR